MGIIAVLPALIALMSGRRRQLSLLKEEIAVLNALPKAATESREAMLFEVSASVAYYHSREERQFYAIRTYGFAVAWLTVVVGTYVYDGTITDPDTLRTFRQYAGVGLIVFGLVALLASIVLNGAMWFLSGTTFYYKRKVKKKYQLLDEEDAAIAAQVEALDSALQETASRRERIEERVVAILEQERDAVASGQTRPPRPEGLDEILEEYETTGTLESLSEARFKEDLREVTDELATRKAERVQALDDFSAALDKAKGTR